MLLLSCHLPECWNQLWDQLCDLKENIIDAASIVICIFMSQERRLSIEVSQWVGAWMRQAWQSTNIVRLIQHMAKGGTSEMLIQGCCILCIPSCLLAKELQSYQPVKKPRQFCALSLPATSLEKKSSRFLSATGHPCMKQGLSIVCCPKQSHFLAGFHCFLWIYHAPFAFASSTENFLFSINSVVTNCYLFRAMLKAKIWQELCSWGWCWLWWPRITNLRHALLPGKWN